MKYKYNDLVFFEQWLKDRVLNDSSVYMYVGVAKKFLKDNPDIDAIDNYNNFLFEYAIKKRSFYYYDALRLFIKYAFSEDTPRRTQLLRLLLKPNKAVDVKRTRRNLDAETKEKIISMLKDYKHRVIAKIQNVTGVRAGDVLRLKRGTISYEAYQDQILVMRIDFTGKGDKHFVKWIFDEATQVAIELFIKNNVLDGEYYFLERTHGWSGSGYIQFYRTNYHHYWADLKQALDMNGIAYKDWATHDFKRSLARKVWDETHDLVILKDMLNHNQADTTLRYLKNSGLQSVDVYYQLSKK